EPRSCWIDVAAMADNAFDDDTVTDAVFDCADRLAGGHSDAVGPRLEFSISEISSFGGLAAGKLRFQLGGFLLEVDPHEPGRGKGHKQQGQECNQECRSR